MSLEKVNINTTQNVLVSYEPAGIMDRALAWLVDAAIIFVYSILILIVGLAILNGSDADGDDKFTLAVIIYTILGLPAFLYDFLCEYFFNGQSIGKKTVCIKVVKLDGTQPSLGAYLLRWMLRLIDFMIGPLIAVFAVSITKNYQRLGDLAAGTTVVKLRMAASLHNTILYRAIPGYQLTFKEVNKLNDRDISIIKEVFEESRKMKDFNSLLKLADKVRKQMGLGVIDMSPEEFINTVLADYTQYEFDT